MLASQLFSTMPRDPTADKRRGGHRTARNHQFRAETDSEMHLRTPQAALQKRRTRSAPGSSAPGQRGRGEQGAALVELALVLPILFMLVFGIYEFGRGYNAKVELTGAVREGARAAALGQSASAAVIAAAPGLSPAPTVNVVTACPNPAPAGANAVVTATYPVTYSIPFFGSGTWTLQVTGVMRCGL